MAKSKQKPRKRTKPKDAHQSSKSEIQEAIDQLTTYRDEVLDCLNGMPITRNDSLYTQDQLKTLRGMDRQEYWQKVRMLFFTDKVRSIRGIVGQLRPSESENIKDAWDDIHEATEDPNRHDWMDYEGGYLKPRWLVKIEFDRLKESLDEIIGKLAEQDANQPEDEKPKRKSRKAIRRQHRKTPPQLEWSKITTKTTIVTALSLTSVHKLNELVKAGIYEIKPTSKNRQDWQIRIDKLPEHQQKKLR